MAWCAPDRCSSLGVSFCACRLPIRHLEDTTSVTPARSRTSASCSVAAMPAPRWFFRFMYDRESATWERRRNEPKHRELVKRTADELANVVAPPGPVAGLGCGPGAHALALARRGYDVIGVDAAPRMVQAARARAARDQVDVRLDVHDVSAPLRFADASLAGVLAILVVQHLPHPAAFIAEIRRCLRPGGHLLITAPARDSASLTSQNLYWRLRAACYHLVPGVVRFYDTNTLLRLVQDQGLTVVECNGEPGRVTVLARAQTRRHSPEVPSIAG
jgi:SAM-dependent methyltransferase